MNLFKRWCSGLVLLASILCAMPFAYAQQSININTATVDELQEMNGVGKTRAQAIVDYREQHGQFTQVDDLLAVDGIGQATLERNRDRLVME